MATIVQRRAVRFDGSGLHFDENKRGTVARHDVQFAEPRPVAPIENCVPETAECPARERFTLTAELLAVHARTDAT